MDPDLLNELQLLCKDAYDASLTGEIASHTLLQKYVAHLNSIWRQLGKGQSIADLVKDWVEAGHGQFYSAHMFAELGLTTRSDKKAADMALRRMSNVTECGDKRGCWRILTGGLEQIDWQSAQPDDTIPLVWPLGLEQYFTLYPTNVIVVAGEKNAGKTSFCLNLVHLNNHLDIPIDYFSSEMASQELAVRVREFPSPEPFKQARFWPLDSDTVADVINPDSINIVDYLEVETDFWMVARQIKRMWKKLKRGIVVVALQKDADSRYGRGKAFSSEKARVYLTMSKTQNMTLTEIKNYKGDKKPDGTVLPYQITNGGLLTKRKVTKPKPSSPPEDTGTSNVRVLRP